MKEKNAGFAWIIAANLFMILLVVGYYFLQVKGHYTIKDMELWIRKVFEKDLPLYEIIFDKRLQYILLTLLYIVLFLFINHFIKSRVTRAITIVIVGLLYSLQIFITDSIINYSSWHIFNYISYMDVNEFAMSRVWHRAMSDYGILICLINFVFMCSVLVTISWRKYYGDPKNFIKKKSNIKWIRNNSDDIDLLDFEFGEDDDDYRDFDLSVDRDSDLPELDRESLYGMFITEMYLHGRIGYKGVCEYVDNLPADMQGLLSLVMIDCFLSDENKVIKSAVKRAETGRFHDLIEMTELDEIRDRVDREMEAESGREDNIIPFDFSRRNKDK